MKSILLIITVVAATAATGLSQQNATGATKILAGSGGVVNDIAFLTDGTRLISGGSDSMVRIWNLADGSVAKTFDLAGEVTGVALSPDGSKLAALVRNREFYLVDIAEGKLLHRQTNGESQAILFEADGKGLLFAIRGGTVRRLDIGTLRSTDLFDCGLETIHGMTTSADHSLIALAGVPQAPARGGRAPRSGRRGVAVPAAPAAAPGRLVVFDAFGGADKAQFLVEFPVLSALSRSPAFSRDAKQIAAVGTRAQVWSMVNGAPLWAAEGQSDQLSVAFAPNGKLVAVGSSDSTVKLLLPDTGREIKSYSASAAQPVRAIRFSPDGKTLAAPWGKDIALFDVPEP